VLKWKVFWIGTHKFFLKYAYICSYVNFFFANLNCVPASPRDLNSSKYWYLATTPITQKKSCYQILDIFNRHVTVYSRALYWKYFEMKIGNQTVYTLFQNTISIYYLLKSSPPLDFVNCIVIRNKQKYLNNFWICRSLHYFYFK